MHYGKYGSIMNMANTYKGKRVFITGHTGFKGTWLCQILQFFGAQIAGYSLEPNSIPSHFNLLEKTGISTINDIANRDALRNSVHDFQPDILFHLAAQPLVRESYNDPVNTYQTNVIGTLNVLETIRTCSSIKAVVIITTDKVYENREWLYAYRENDQLGGHDLYSSSKACAEILTSSYQRSFFDISNYKKTHNVLIATARAGNVIGGGDWSANRLIPDIVKATINNEVTKIRNPNSIRPWQHVLDCLNGYLMLGEKLMQENLDFVGAWNFSPYSFESKTVADVAEIARIVWPDIRIEFGKDDTKYHEATLLKLDNTKAIAQLNWQPKWDTKKAIEETIFWYRNYYLNNQILTKNQIVKYFSHNEI